MPVHLLPRSRREFLTVVGTALATSPAIRLHASAAGRTDPNLVVLLNDTHISEKHAADAPIRQHLVTTVNHILALERRPAAVFINGDLAMRDGQPGDYRLFARLIAPLRDAGIPLHLTLGNHDNREVFFTELAAEKTAAAQVISRQASVVSTPRAHFVLCDSLQHTMAAPGEVGEEQRGWLARTLRELGPGKPTLVLAHHNPRVGGDPKHYAGGLVDSEPLWALLAAQPHVKAYVHGHIHRWGRSEHSGIHIVNTPATSYVGDASSTPGWTMARLHDKGATLTTHTYASDHPWNGREHDFQWRT